MNTMKDRNGKQSSKRTIGAFCAAIGMVVLLITWLFSLQRMVGDPATAIEIGKLLFIGGLSLLGISVFEFVQPGQVSPPSTTTISPPVVPPAQQ